MWMIPQIKFIKFYSECFEFYLSLCILVLRKTNLLRILDYLAVLWDEFYIWTLNSRLLRWVIVLKELFSRQNRLALFSSFTKCYCIPSNEAHFHCGDCVNKLHMRYWSSTYSVSFTNLSSIYQVSVWCMICADSTVGPYFFEYGIAPPLPSHPTATPPCWDHFLHPTSMIVRVFRSRNYGFNKMRDMLPLRIISLRGDDLNWPALSPDSTPSKGVT